MRLTRYLSWGIIAGLALATTAPARADDKARRKAAQQLATEQFRSPGDEDTAGRWDEHGVVWLPGKPIDSDGATSQMTWAMGPPYLDSIRVTKSAIGWKGSWGWIAADLTITQRPYSDSSGPEAPAEQHHYHWLEVVVASGKAVGPRALLVTDSIADAQLAAGPAAAAAEPHVLSAMLASPATIAVNLAPDAEIAVFGSSPGEVGLGSAAAKKLLGQWKKLKITVVGAPREIIDGDLGVALADVDLLYKNRPVRLRAMLVARKASGGTWQVVALDYGADSPFGDPPHE
jgi:hypothetical protein